MQATAGPLTESPVDDARYRLTAFGLEVASDFPLPGAAAPRPEKAGRVDLVLRTAPRDHLDRLVEDQRYLRFLHQYEGCGYAMLEGENGDILFHYRERAVFHLSADRTTLRCAVSESGTAWQRVLLDTVLWTISLLYGFELLHASAVSTAGGLIALVGQSGDGKTTLAGDLIGRGATLFCDDIIALEQRDGHAVAHPAPPLMKVSDSIDARQWGARELAELSDERWVVLPRDTARPQALTAIVLLQRTKATMDCVSLSATSLDLMPHLVSLPYLSHRRRLQFEIAGCLASDAAVLRLATPHLADPSLATDLLLDHLDLRGQTLTPGGTG